MDSMQCAHLSNDCFGVVDITRASIVILFAEKRSVFFPLPNAESKIGLHIDKPSRFALLGGSYCFSDVSPCRHRRSERTTTGFAWHTALSIRERTSPVPWTPMGELFYHQTRLKEELWVIFLA